MIMLTGSGAISEKPSRNSVMLALPVVGPDKDLGTVTIKSLLTLTKETGANVFTSVNGPAFESTARPMLVGPAPSVTVSPMSLTPWPVTAK